MGELLLSSFLGFGTRSSTGTIGMRRDDSVSREEIRIGKIIKLAQRFPSNAADGRHATTGLPELDDCAVVPFGAEIDLVIGSDFVRGEEFHLFSEGLLSWKDVGYYLIAANASDLAAMGATPMGVVVVFRTHSGVSETDHDSAMEGVAEACAEFGMPLLGGDSGGYTASVLSAAAIGTCPHDRALLRRNGQPGDIVYISDDIGTAGAASAWFLRGRTSEGVIDVDVERRLISSWKRPRPALALGALLVKEKLSRCAIDTSDGLKASARQIAQATGLDIILSPDSIPISQDARWVAKQMGIDPLALAAGDSVDFRLLFSSPSGNQSELQRTLSDAGLSFHAIGELRPTRRTPSVYIERDERLLPMPGIEWDQSEETTIDRLLEQETTDFDSRSSPTH